MATTTNNSGINGDVEDEFGPDERYDDETQAEFEARMRRKAAAKKVQEELKKSLMPPCIG